MLLMAGVATGAITLLMMSVDFERQSMSQNRSKNEAYTAVERLSREIREATLVNIEGANGEELVLTRQNGRKVRYAVQWDSNGFGTLMFAPNANQPRRVPIARGLTSMLGAPIFSRNQNVIYITFRVGDAEWTLGPKAGERSDLERASNAQGVDIRTVASLRRGS